MIRSLESGLQVLLVADGLGGQPGGEVAAALVVNYIEERPDPVFQSSLETLLTESSNLILRHGAKHPLIDGMGSTATLAVINKRTISWAHVGDCRLYHLSGQVLRCITRDQTIARQAYDRGEISLSEIVDHPHNHVLEQCLGEEDIEPDSGEFTWNERDVILICSDGLHNMISKKQISAILRMPTSLDEKADLLLNSALKAGGKDNISLILGNYTNPRVTARP